MLFATVERKHTITTQYSKYVGVSWDPYSQKWITKVTIDNSQKYIGSYDTELEAAKKFDTTTRQNNSPQHFNFPRRNTNEKVTDGFLNQKKIIFFIKNFYWQYVHSPIW